MLDPGHLVIGQPCQKPSSPLLMAGVSASSTLLDHAISQVTSTTLQLLENALLVLWLSGMVHGWKRWLPVARPQLQMCDLGQAGADQALHVAVHAGQA